MLPRHVHFARGGTIFAAGINGWLFGRILIAHHP
jgi:hypothetical protein